MTQESSNNSSSEQSELPTSNSNEMQTNATSGGSPVQGLPSSNTHWLSLYDQILQTPLSSKADLIPPLIRSALVYVVLENELKLSGKRRIVFLNNSDLLYGSISGKCVFMPINWDMDRLNVVKVHGGNMTWQTSFSELIQTHPTALLSLFATNELWAEGNYEPLA